MNVYKLKLLSVTENSRERLQALELASSPVPNATSQRRYKPVVLT